MKPGGPVIPFHPFHGYSDDPHVKTLNAPFQKWVFLVSEDIMTLPEQSIIVCIMLWILSGNKIVMEGKQMCLAMDSWNYISVTSSREFPNGHDGFASRSGHNAPKTIVCPTSRTSDKSYGKVKLLICKLQILWFHSMAFVR